MTLSGAMSVSASAKVSAPSKVKIYQTQANDKGYFGKKTGSSVDLNIGTLKKAYTVEVDFKNKSNKGTTVVTYKIK